MKDLNCEQDFFELMFELVDIESIEDVGMKNTYDIHVTGNNTFTLGNGIVSHNSAFGGLSPVLGREDIGYYVAQGKPLNAYSARTSDFTSNPTMKDLMQIIDNEGYEKIVIATDADLDGVHIQGLLIGFVHKYQPEYKNGKLGRLRTPVIAVKKNKKLVRWIYNLNDNIDVKSGEESKYYKGLGSWKEADLKYVVEKDGINKMIDIFEFDEESDKIIDDWLGNDSEPRKKYILDNDFNIAKL